jgi:acetyltransferase-like isoleucine patch superfamily enzyme
MDDWRSDTGLSREEFTRLTRYCNTDTLLDARNRAIALGLPNEGVKVATGAIVRVVDPSLIRRNAFIGLYTYVNGHVTIGEDVLIGPHCSITSNNHVFEAKTGHFSGNKGEPIVIGDGCWLAAGAMVTAGVTLGRSNLVCANAVVTRSTPAYAIMAGVPARQVGEIDARTGEYRWFAQQAAHAG